MIQACIYELLLFGFECMSSDDGGEATPVPMPNTEVKLSSADGSSVDPC